MLAKQKENLEGAYLFLTQLASKTHRSMMTPAEISRYEAMHEDNKKLLDAKVAVKRDLRIKVVADEGTHVLFTYVDAKEHHSMKDFTKGKCRVSKSCLKRDDRGRLELAHTSIYHNFDWRLAEVH